MFRNESFVNAITNSDINLLNDILSKNPDAVNTRDLEYNGKTYTPLTLAATVWLNYKGPSRQRDAIMDMLLNYPGIDINSRDSDGNTCLIIASKSNREEMIEKLLFGGADVNATNNANQKAIDVASHEASKIIIHNFPIRTQELINDIMTNSADAVKFIINAIPSRSSSIIGFFSMMTDIGHR